MKLKQKIEAHALVKPIRPKLPRLIYDQFTPAAFIKGLNESHPLALVLSDEAGTFFASPRVQETPLLNSAWNGADIRKDLASSGSVHIPSPRISVSLQMQPEYFFTTKDRHSLELRESGFLARCLVSFPPSTQGSRFGTFQPDEKKGLDQFHNRIRELLEAAFSEDGTQLRNRQCLRFSDRSKAALNQLNIEIESNLQRGGFLCSMRDFASKISEHVCRLAAIFHIIEGRPGLVIDGEEVERAIDIITWYAYEFDRLIVRSMAPTLEEEDAQKLLEWFQKRLSTHGDRAYTITEINKNGPSKMRNNGRVAQALQRLMHQQSIISWIVPPTSPKGRAKTTYSLRVQYPLPTAYPEYTPVSSAASGLFNF